MSETKSICEWHMIKVNVDILCLMLFIKAQEFKCWVKYVGNGQKPAGSMITWNVG